LGDWAPERVEHVTVSSGATHTIYLWRIGR
jgi:hypothetical protein